MESFFYVARNRIMFKPSRNSVMLDPLGDPLAGDPRVTRNRRAYDPVTAAISAGTSLVGGLMSSNAAEDAAQTQADAANQAAQLQNNQFNQIRDDLAPYRNLGTAAINPLLQAMGFNAPAASSTPQLTYDQIYQQLLPQFTTTTPGTASGSAASANPYAPNTPAWRIWNAESVPPSQRSNMQGPIGGDQDFGVYNTANARNGYSTSSVDYAGLNAAVQAQLKQQQDNQYSNIFNNLTKDPNNILNQTFSFNPGDLTKTPGYEWNYAQGMRAVNNSAASRGLGLSGAQLKGAETFASGLADNTYQNQYNNALTQYQTNYNAAANNVNRLMSLLGVGQSAANQTGAYGMQNAANMGNYLTSGANAQASGQVGSANALSNALSGVGNNALLYSMLGNMNGGSGGVTLYGLHQ